VAANVRKRRNRKKGAYLEKDEIIGFDVAIRSDPVLIHRFVNVPICKVQTLANSMLDLQRTTWMEGLKEMIMPFLN